MIYDCCIEHLVLYLYLYLYILMIYDTICWAWSSCAWYVYFRVEVLSCTEEFFSECVNCVNTSRTYRAYLDRLSSSCVDLCACKVGTLPLLRLLCKIRAVQMLLHVTIWMSIHLWWRNGMKRYSHCHYNETNFLTP